MTSVAYIAEGKLYLKNGEAEPNAEPAEDLPELTVVWREARGIRFLPFCLVFFRPLIRVIGGVFLPFRFRGHDATPIEPSTG